MRTTFVDMALDAQRCHIARAVFDAADGDERAALAAELLEAVRAPRSRHAVQEIVEMLHGGMLAAVAEKLIGQALAGQDCRVAQKVLDAMRREDLAVLEGKLRGRLQEALALTQARPVAQIMVRPEGMLAAVAEEFLDLAFNAEGCRVVQKALEGVRRDELPAFTEQLRGRVQEALVSPHANHVAQKVVEVTPPEMVDFMAGELAGVAVRTAEHRFGCRFLCRLLEYWPSEMTCGLVGELLAQVDRLCRHKYGNHVIQSVLEYGSRGQREVVVQAILKDPSGLATHSNASYVIEKAWAHFSGQERLAFAEALAPDAAAFEKLACSQSGTFAARLLVRCPEAEWVRALAAEMTPRLQSDSIGKRVLAELAEMQE